MSQAKRKKERGEPKERETTISWHFSKRIYEGLLIISTAISIFLLLSLFTYHFSDPGWSKTGATNHIANIGGFVGAWISDVLLSVFGYIAYLFPIMLAIVSVVSLKDRQLEGDNSRALFILRAVGFFLVLLSASSLADLYIITQSLPLGSGGILGDLLGAVMARVFNVFGAGLILFALLLAGTTLFSGLSWGRVVDLAGFLAIKIARGFAYLWCLVLHRNSEEEYIVSDTKPQKAETKVGNKLKKEPPTIKINHSESKILFELSDETAKPSLSLLDLPSNSNKNAYSREQLEKMSHEVELRLADFGIEAQVVAVHPGPVITRFELQLAAGTKASKITALAKDLARSLSVVSVRVVEVIPGKSVIGLELPNESREVVRLREILSTKQYRHTHAPLALALGKDISGNPVIVDLAKMPHLLLAGTTGSGKSVSLNAILLSLLYKYSPKELKMILIDPKMLELSIYDDIPHLLTPVVTNMKEAANALRWCVAEMERRYKLMASLGVRNIVGYNAKIRDAINKKAPLLDPLWDKEREEQPEELRELPYIVVFADEYADMIMVVGKKVEELIARIAQKARAAGIHLILATQRPSVDVITGLIKANIPSRIAFQVSSRIDSRTILDQMGAEQLLGSGDMLYLPPGTVVPVRVHGAFVADEEVHKVVKDLKKKGQPEYIEEIVDGSVGDILGIDATGSGDDDPERDQFYDLAVAFIMETKRVSISSIQRKFKIGYNRAARIVEAMETAGLVSPMQNNGSREILVPDRND